MRRSTKTIIAALAAAGMLAWPLRADLAQASPFLPPNSQQGAGGAGGSSGPVELRGIMATDQGVQCCIYDTAKKSSVWVGLNESGYDFVVKSVNATNDSANVFYQGRSMQLDLRTAKVASAGTAQPGNPVVAPNGPGLPSVADEQRRLDAVAAEVRRRRLEREKAFQNPGAPPQPAPPTR